MKLICKNEDHPVLASIQAKRKALLDYAKEHKAKHMAAQEALDKDLMEFGENTHKESMKLWDETQMYLIKNDLVSTLKLNLTAKEDGIYLREEDEDSEDDDGPSIRKSLQKLKEMFVNN